MIEAQEHNKKLQEVGKIFDETKKEMYAVIDDGGKDKKEKEEERENRKALKKLMKEIKKQIEEQPGDKEEQFEWQKKHFDVADKRDLMRDIVVIYHDKQTNTYWEKTVFRFSKNEHNWRKISKEQFESPETLRTKYKSYPVEHILVVDQKYNKLNYEKAKAILDEQRIRARIKKDEEKKK